MKLKTMTGGPPDVTPTMKTPLRAVQLEIPLRKRDPRWLSRTHEVTMLKLKPIILSRPKDRLSSAVRSQSVYSIIQQLYSESG